MALPDTNSFRAWCRGKLDVDRLGIRVRAVVFAALCGVTAGLLLLSLPRLLITQSAALKFDMEISAGSTVGLFVNRFDRAPARIDIAPKLRQVYSFDGNVSDISIFRIDLSDQIGVTIKMYGALAGDEDGVLRRFGPADIARWPRAELTLVDSGPDSVTFVSSGTNPYLLVGDAIQLRRSLPPWVSSLLADANSFRFFAPLTVIGFALMLFVALVEARRASHLLLAAVTTAAAVLFAQWLSGAGGLEHLSRTVGRAAFFGNSTRGNSNTLLATLALSFLVALLAAAVLRRKPQGNVSQDRLPRYGMAFGLIVVLLIVVPDLTGLFAGIASRHFTPDWDGNNIVAWQWLAHEGYVPLRDFWFPYGGFCLFSLPAPWGVLSQSLYTCFVYGVLFVVLCRSTSKPLASCAFVLFVYVGERIGLFPGAWRYLLVILVVLSYAMNTSRDRRVLFWICCAVTCVFEPVQLVYSAPAVAIILLLDIYQGKAWALRPLIGRLVGDFAVPAVFVIAYVAFIVLVQGKGALDFYGSVGDGAIYAAEPTDLVTAVRNPLSIQFLIFVVPFACLAIGLAERLRRSGPDAFANVMIALGAAGFMMLQKHIVRPMDWQLYMIVCVSVALYVMFSWQRAGLLGQAVTGAIIGVAIAVLAQVGALASLRNLAVSAPSRLAGSVMALASPKQPFATLNAEAYAPEKFDFKDERAVVADLAAHAPDGRIPRLFVLGDTPVLYILTRQLPPYHVNDFNASPIYEQKKMADFVERERPPTVVWDPNTQSFDLFQSTVRNPLVYNAVISGYVPDRQVARFEILKRRAPNEPIALDFWRSKLGSTVALGHFPRASSFPALAPCTSASADCQEFLTIAKKDPAFAGKIAVGVNVDGRPFEITMQTVAGDRELYVSLDRLWFWGPMKAAGLAPRIDANTTSAGIDVVIRPVARRDDILY